MNFKVSNDRNSDKESYNLEILSSSKNSSEYSSDKEYSRDASDDTWFHHMNKYFIRISLLFLGQIDLR